MKFGSLFAGIGGLDLGLERAGMQCAWQCEIDDYATKVLEKHWPDVRRHRDIRTFPPRSVEASYSWRGCPSGPFAPDVYTDRTREEWGVDLICGGFPCQDISYAGKGAGLDGERSGLFFEALRVVQELRPRYVLLENVAALLGRGLDRVLGELAQIGFDAEWHCIPAAAVGAPHIRDRVFIIAYATSPRLATAGPIAGNQGWADSSGERWRYGEFESRDDGIDGDVADSSITRLSIAERETMQRERRREERRATTERGWWAVEPDVGRVAHGISKRVDRLRCLGNAVVPQVAEYIGRRIMQAEKETQCP